MIQPPRRDEYAYYEALWRKKAVNRPYKALNNNSYQNYQLWKDGGNFQVKVYWPGSQRAPKIIAVVDQTSKWTVYPSALSHMSFVFWAYSYIGLRVRSEANRRRSCKRWIYASNGKLPCFDGMQIQNRTHLNPEVVEQKVRKVVYEKAKPIIQKLRPWERLGRSYFAVGDAAMIVQKYQETPICAVFPLEEEPTVDGIIRLARGRLGTPWWFNQGNVRPRELSWMLRKLRSGFFGAVSAIKESEYEKAGVFEWVPLDKTG